MKPYRQKFEVAFDYPVLFERDVLDPENRTLLDTLKRKGEDRRHRAVVFIDQGLAEARPDLAGAFETYFRKHDASLELVMPPKAVTGGEAIKNDYRLVMEVVDIILEHQLCRQSFVIAAGGGAVLDAVGFAASIVHRGLRMVRLPSTVLAQNDAGIGVKTGMNLHGGKNTIGTFQPPFAVINDPTLLESLPDAAWCGGISEAFKVAMIKDRPFFDWLCAHATRLRDRDPGSMACLVRRCAELHLDHIRDNGDPFELGTARPLDFGHWAAHKLECMSNYRIGHGQAVAVGIAIDSLYARKNGWISEQALESVIQGFSDSGLPLWYDEMDYRLGDGSYEILQGVRDFQEHLGGELCVTFPDGIGAKFEKHEMDQGLIAHCLSELRVRAEAPNAVASRS